MNLVSTRAPLFRNWLPARPCSCCTLPATVTHPAFPRRGISGTSSDSWSNLSATTSGTSNTNDELSVTADVSPSRFDWRTRLRSPKQREKHSESLLRASRLWYHHQNLPKGLRRVSQPQDDVMPGEPYFEEIQAYKDRFLPLLRAEQEHEWQTFEKRLTNWTLERLKREGYCMTDLGARWTGKRYHNRHIAEFTLGPDTPLPEHSFDAGVQVILTRLDPVTEYLSLHRDLRSRYEGYVVRRRDNSLQISFFDKFDIHNGTWRLDLGVPNGAYVRMREAIEALNYSPAHQERRDPCTSVMGEQVALQGTYLREQLLGSFKAQGNHAHIPLQEPDDASYPDTATLSHENRTLSEHSGTFADDQFLSSWVKRYSRAQPVRVEGDPDLDGLNSSQVRAIALMIGERLSLVQGPPGTGKTRTIIETIRLLKQHFMVPHPIAVCTYTNVAVDNLLEGFAARGMAPLRVGAGSRVKPSLVQYTLDEKMKAHPLDAELKAVAVKQEQSEKQIKQLEEKIASLTDIANLGKSTKQLSILQDALSKEERRLKWFRSKESAIKKDIQFDVLNKADVICTTCLSASYSALELIDFPVVFLDEASMSTEPATLIPLMKGSRHVSLIGDHKQLPPVITSAEAQEGGLGISLFERLTEEGEVPSIMLDTQYRMHPTISRFPAGEFYEHKLRDGIHNPSELRPPQSMHLKAADDDGTLPSVIFLDHTGNESKRGNSRLNWNEAHIICSIAEDLLLHNSNLTGHDVGIIAPYAAQITLLSRLFRTDPSYKQRFEATLGTERAKEMLNIEIKTVDGFEGREKEVIVFSTVRNNPEGNIGFLADRRRLNVGLTRAKRGLFVVGSLSTLQKAIGAGPAAPVARVTKGGEAWQRYASYLLEHKRVAKLQGKTLRDTLYGNLPPEFKEQYLSPSRGSYY